MTDSLTGQLLVASSVVSEPMYAAGVCLVVHQDNEQVIGVMLNRPIKIASSAILGLEDAKNTSESSDVVNRRSLSHTPSESDSSGSHPAGSQSAPSISKTLHFGGPVSGPVVAIHQNQNQAEAETGDGIYVAAQKDHLESLVRDNQVPYRLIVGHLAWKLDDLEKEMAAGYWHQVPATSKTVFCSDQEMWPTIIRRATSNSVAKWLGIPDAKGAGELN
jgi:putative transcriptional regulator